MGNRADEGGPHSQRHGVVERVFEHVEVVEAVRDQSESAKGRNRPREREQAGEKSERTRERQRQRERERGRDRESHITYRAIGSSSAYSNTSRL
jgi:hypothetical protein